MLLTFLNVLKPARIEPPIQVEYFRSGGAKILIFSSLIASFFVSFSSRSPKPWWNEERRQNRRYRIGGGPTFAKRAAATQHDVGVEIFAKVHVHARY